MLSSRRIIEVSSVDICVVYSTISQVPNVMLGPREVEAFSLGVLKAFCVYGLLLFIPISAI